MMSIRPYLFFIIFLTFFTTGLSALELPKMGYVDVDRVVRNYTLTERMKTRMKRERERFQAEVLKRQKEIQKLDAEISVTNISPEIQKDKLLLKMRKEHELRLYIHRTEILLKDLKADLTAQIYSRVARAIEKIGRDKGFVVLFRKADIYKLEDVLYQFHKFDVTQDVQNLLYKELTLQNR